MSNIENKINVYCRLIPRLDEVKDWFVVHKVPGVIDRIVFEMETNLHKFLEKVDEGNVNYLEEKRGEITIPQIVKHFSGSNNSLALYAKKVDVYLILKEGGEPFNFGVDDKRPKINNCTLVRSFQLPVYKDFLWDYEKFEKFMIEAIENPNYKESCVLP